MRTSIDIPDTLFRRAKKLASERGSTLRDLLLDGLESALSRAAGGRKHRLKDCSLGQGGLIEGLDWSDTERIDALSYGDRG